jgi:hypothetical protein
VHLGFVEIDFWWHLLGSPEYMSATLQFKNIKDEKDDLYSK